MKLPRNRYGTASRRGFSSHPAAVGKRYHWPFVRGNPRETTVVLGARSQQIAQIEALLFMSAEPVSAAKLAETLHLTDTAAAVALIGELHAFYAADESAFTVHELAGGYQLRTGPETTPWLLRLKRMPAYHQLPATLLETLTVIAYKQPITRADVEAIRGVACADAIKLLMGKGMVRTAGRHQSLGRPQLYATTKRFLQHFGMNTLAELPQVLPD